MNIVLQRPSVASGADAQLTPAKAGQSNGSPVDAKAPGPMPDIANAPHVGAQGTLDWVGMGAVHTPVRLSAAASTTAPAEVQIYVNLTDEQAKGIHMSRLYLALESFCETEAISPRNLRALLDDMLASHTDLSDQAAIEFRFPFQRKQPALLSDNSGWQSYPITLKSQIVNGIVVTDLTVEVTYSSTCPCSAALARQLISESFRKRFDGQASISLDDAESWLSTEQGINATPHSQRSTARVTTRLADDASGSDLVPLMESLIDRLENALGTPVQTAVKREDEQEFARLNGENLMFCEDAARKLKRVLNDDSRVSDFKLRIDHYESLHAHNAVAMASKGVAGGFRSDF